MTALLRTLTDALAGTPPGSGTPPGALVPPGRGTPPVFDWSRALLACLALCLAILVIGHTGPAVEVFLILGVLGLLALFVGLGSRIRR